MNDSILNYAKFGIVHSMAFPRAIENEHSYIDSIKEILYDPFFSVIELGQNPFDSLKYVTKNMVETAKCTLTYSAHSRLFKNNLNANSLDSNIREATVKELKKAIDEAYELNAVNFQFLSGHWQEQTKDQALEALCETTIEICNYAKEKGDMPVCLEIFDYDIDKCSLIGKADLAAKYCKIVRKYCDNFGLMVDLSHIPMIRESIEDHLYPIKDYIIHAHMGNTSIKDKDDIAYGDNHPRFGYQNGENDVEQLRKYLKILLDIGYLNKQRKNILSFEVKPLEGEDPKLIIANSKRTLFEAWHLV